MKRLIFILLLVICCSIWTSKTEATPPLESGTYTWRQVTYGTLGLTLSVIPYVYMIEKRLPIQRRFKSENPNFLDQCVLKGMAIATIVGPFAVLELCARGIEFGYKQQYGSEYRGNMWKTRAAVALGVPITFVGGGMSFMVGGAGTEVLVVSTVSALAFLTVPSILGARSYNKSLKKKPMETEINILRVAF